MTDDNRQEKTIRKKLRKVQKMMDHNRKHGKNRFYMFLDFDGVINIVYQEGTSKYVEFLKRDQTVLDFSDHECIRRISDFCVKHHVDIVISSSWRYSGLDYCRDYLLRGGLSEDVNIIGVTGTDWDVSREELILNYLLEHPNFSKFIILDDMPMEILKEYEVLTDMYSGFDEKSVEIAENISKKTRHHRFLPV